MAKPSRFLLCCLGVWAVGQANADEVPPAWAGVWQGTVGKAELRMCLQQQSYTASSGMYYYTRYLRLIPLSMLDSPGDGGQSAVLDEAVPDPADKTGDADKAIHAGWTLRLGANDSALDGMWRAQAKALPVHLTRVQLADPHAPAPATQDTDFCASDAFNAPREGPASVEAANVRVGGTLGTAYRAVKLDFGGRFQGNVKSFELLRDDEGARRFNAAQREALQSEQRESFGCTRSVMATSIGNDSYYNAARTPLLIGRHWVVSDIGSDGFCGGAHQTIYRGREIWNLNQGGVVSPWDWFRVDGSKGIGEDLSEKLAKVWALDGEDCKAMGDNPGDFSWDVYPSAKGMVFVPSLSYAMRMCIDDVTLPWRQVLPLLNAKGRKAVASIRAEFAKPPAR